MQKTTIKIEPIKQKKRKKKKAKFNELLLKTANYSIWSYFVRSDNVLKQKEKFKPKTWVERINKQIEPFPAEAKKIIPFIIWSPIKSLSASYTVLRELIPQDKLHREVAYELGAVFLTLIVNYYASSYLNKNRSHIEKYITSNDNSEQQINPSILLAFAGLALLNKICEASITAISRSFELRNKYSTMDSWNKLHYKSTEESPYYNMSLNIRGISLTSEAPKNIGQIVRTANETLIKTFAAFVNGGISLIYLAKNSEYNFSLENVIAVKMLFGAVISLSSAYTSQQYANISEEITPKRTKVQEIERNANNHAYEIRALKIPSFISKKMLNSQGKLRKGERQMTFYQIFDEYLVKSAAAIDSALNCLLVINKIQKGAIDDGLDLSLNLFKSSEPIFLSSYIAPTINELNAALKGMNSYFTEVSKAKSNKLGVTLINNIPNQRDYKISKEFIINKINTYSEDQQEMLLGFRDDLIIRSGSINLLSGNSGSGKTTFLEILAGMPKTHFTCAGGIFFPYKHSLEDVYFIPQNDFDHIYSSFKELILLGLDLTENDKKTMIDFAREVIVIELGMESLASNFDSLEEEKSSWKKCLSGGQHKIVTAAFMLIKQGAIKNGHIHLESLPVEPTDKDTLILLDEMFNGMDTRLVTKVQNSIIKYWSKDGKFKATIISVDHKVSSNSFYTNTLDFYKINRASVKEGSEKTGSNVIAIPSTPERTSSYDEKSSNDSTNTEANEVSCRLGNDKIRNSKRILYAQQLSLERKSPNKFSILEQC